MKKSCLLILMLAGSSFAHAEEEQSLSDILNVEIVTASKKSENKFDAPLSSSVVTREEIDRSGVTTIQEALRLSSSIVTRQLTNGSFEYNIRGTLAPARGGTFQEKQPGTVLVMIDNHIVFNYFTGAVFWDSLPIGLHDVEQIEIVKGPSSALYGPNAVSGVINIITRKPKENGGLVTANYGSYHTYYGGAAYSIVGERDAFRISVNGDRRNRYYKEWYSYNTSPNREKHTREGDVGNVVSSSGTTKGYYKSGYPKPERANNSGSALMMWSRKLSDGEVAFTSSYQSSRTQTLFADSIITSYLNREFGSGNANLQVNYSGLSANFDYIKGFADLRMGTPNHRYKHEYVIKDAIIEKNFEVGSFEFKPGINYKTALYDAYFIQGKKQLTVAAAMFRSEYKGDSTRIVAAIRNDKANKPDTTTLGYQLSVLQRLSKSGNLRLVVGQASASPFVYDTYLQDGTTLSNPLGTYTSSSVGRTDDKLLEVLSGEVGARYSLNSNVGIDVELFQYRAQNYVQFFSTTEVVIDPTTQKAQVTAKGSLEPLDYKPLTRGGTASLEFVSSDKQYSGKFFLTAQETNTQGGYTWGDQPPFRGVEKGKTVFYPGKHVTQAVAEPKYDPQTPKMYGGMYFNILSGKFNHNITAYGMSKSEISNKLLSHDIPAFLVLNTQTAYKFSDASSVSFNVRNLTNSKIRQYGITEKIPTHLVLGLDTEI